MAVFASYTHQDDQAGVGDQSDHSYVGQPFTVSGNCTLTSIDCYLDKLSGSPVGNVVITVRADSSGSPGSVLETLAAISASGLPARGSHSPTNSAAASTTHLVTGTTYWLVYDRSANVSNANSVCFENGATTVPYAGYKYSTDASTWGTAQTGSNINFSLNGTADAASPLLPNVNDSVTISEAVTIQLVSFISVNDTVTHTESAPVAQVFIINVNDSVSHTEFVSIQLGPIYQDATSNSGYEATLSTYSWTHTTGVGLNGILVVGVAIFATGTVSSITYNGQALTFLRADSNGVYRSEFWYIINPSSGANTVTVNLSTSLTSISGAVSYFGVSPSDPFENATGANGVGGSDTVNVTTGLQADWVIGVTANAANPIAAGSGQTERVNVGGALGSIGFADRNAISPPATVAMNWTGTGALNPWAITAAAMVPVTDVPDISVSDSVTVSESITVTIRTTPSVSDAVSVSEAVTMMILDFQSVSDAVTVSENLSITVADPLSFSDAVTVSEAISLDIRIQPNVLDSVTVAESSQMQVVLFFSVADSVTVSENTQIAESYQLSVFDAVSVSEGSEALDATYPTSHKDSDDGIGSPVYPTGRGQSYISSGGTLSRIQWFISKSGSPVGNAVAKIYASSGSFPNIVPTGSALATSNSVLASTLNTVDTLTDFNFTGANAIALTAGVTYVITLEFTGDASGNLFIGTDSTGGYSNQNNVFFNSGSWSASSGSYIFSEYAQRIIIEIVNLPNVSDSVTVAENFASNIIIPPNVFDSITVSESPTLSVLKFVNVSDSVSVAESVTISAQSLSVSETVTVSESVAVLIRSFESVSDTVTVSESVTMLLVSSRSVFDTVTVSEGVTVTVIDLPSLSDTITVSESVSLQVMQYPTVFDSVSVTEAVSFDIRVQPSVADSVSVAEFVDLHLVFQETVSDVVTVSENVTIFLPYLTLSVSDSVTVGEFMQFNPTNFESVFDTITVSEAVTVFISDPITLADSVTVSENVILSLVFAVSTVDFVSVSDVPSVDVAEVISVNDAISVSEFVNLNLARVPVVNDAVLVSETVTVHIQSAVPVYDIVTITESVSLRVGRPPVVNFRPIQLAFPVLGLVQLGFHTANYQLQIQNP